MLNIQSFTCNPVGANCYVLSDETGAACIVDPGQASKEEEVDLNDYISHNKLQPSLLLCTHGHFDHVWGAKRVSELYGIPPRLHADDIELARDFKGQVELFFGTQFARKVSTHVQTSYLEIDDGNLLIFGSHALLTLHTPGHSPGGVCFWEESEEVLLTGDTLFRGSVGRTDLSGGNINDLLLSVKTKLLNLPGSTRVLPGHGPETTIDHERFHNPYLW